MKAKCPWWHLFARVPMYLEGYNSYEPGEVYAVWCNRCGRRVDALAPEAGG